MNAYVEFGSKIQVSMMNGIAFLEDLSWDAFNEGTRLMSTDVPLHCFVRSRHEPVFRIVEFLADPMVVRLAVEHGPTAAVVREQFVLRRGRNGRLGVESRRRSG